MKLRKINTLLVEMAPCQNVQDKSIARKVKMTRFVYEWHFLL